MNDLILWFDQANKNDIDRIGGKNASLGEMINHLSGMGVNVPKGFATTTEAFDIFLLENNLVDRIQKKLEETNVNDLSQLAQAGKQIRGWIMAAELPKALEIAIAEAYQKLNDTPCSVAVRSSATAEDLPDASFAGQQETFLNISGIEAVLQSVKHVFASLYNDRAIAYRVHQGFDQQKIALSAGIQKMVRSDEASSGVMFTIDTESGFSDVIFLTSSYGLGEMVVQGEINPDEFYIYKPNLSAGKPAILRRHCGSKLKKMIFTEQTEPGKSVEKIPVRPEVQREFSLTDKEVEELGHYACQIEKHYGQPMDIEWGKDALDGKLYILQARPETVKSQEKKTAVKERYELISPGKVVCTGRSVGQKIATGKVKILKHIHEMDRIQPGDILVTDMTDPDWEPIMKRAAAIVTNRGGRTCHAAIIARELGIPAVVGCGDVTEKVQEGQILTVSCAEGDVGYLYEGECEFKIDRLDLTAMPEIPAKIMMNIGNPERAFDFQSLPNEGVGLARLEFIISNTIGIHPQAILAYPNLPAAVKSRIDERITGYTDPVKYYVEKLKEGIATIAAAFSPKPVIVRLSDFKSNEYANLIGGELYEPKEENPMLGFRGASRYISEVFRPCFELECEALRLVRNEMGLVNVQIMVPFVRTLKEAKKITELLAENQLIRGENSLKIIMMCELPSNAILAEQYLEYFDGFSIGSNDLTQLTLGLDRDSSIIADSFDERDPAVKTLLSQAIHACKKANKYIGICGQGPSDHPDLAEWLIGEGIDSLSLNPDTVVSTWLFLAKEN